MKFLRGVGSIGATPPRPRNLRIHGRRTSARLEEPFWDVLEEIAATLEMPLDELCERISDNARRGNLSSEIRVFALTWSRKKARLRLRKRLS